MNLPKKHWKTFVRGRTKGTAGKKAIQSQATNSGRLVSGRTKDTAGKKANQSQATNYADDREVVHATTGTIETYTSTDLRRHCCDLGLNARQCCSFCIMKMIIFAFYAQLMDDCNL